VQLLAILPGIWAAIVAFSKSPQQALLNVYIPVLLCLPDYYRWIVPGIPKPSFSHAAILPIALAFVLKGGLKWRVSLGDFLVLGFAFFVGYSEYSNNGYKEAQNLMFEMVCLVVLPYALTKGLVEPNGLRVAFGKKLVFCLFVVSIISVYEFKFASTPWRMLLDRFFPGQGDGWVTTFRWGFARVAGPYGHAILAGTILIVGYRIQRWLEWSGQWEPHFQKISLPWPKARVITLGLAAGILMTMVRGPWIGGVLAAGITMIGRAKNRWFAIAVVGGVLVVVGIPVGTVFYRYAAVGRANAKTVAQESAAYRKELIDKYVGVALQRSALGWGRNTWPKVDGMPSIDNYYLLLAIMHGVPAMACLLGIILITPLRLFLFEMKVSPPQPRGSSLGFTLMAIYIAIGWTIATVYLGAQLMPLLFVITGWAEGYLLSGRISLATAPARVFAPPFRFQRTVA
jgi:hypothetical protein